MLKKINPILSPEMLSTLREMGHGDKLAIVDGNYPAKADAGRLIRADGLDLIPVLDAVLDILPIDKTSDAIVRAVNAVSPDQPDPIHERIIETCLKYGQQVSPLKPDLFYARVRSSFSIIATSERSLYANVILTKGVIMP